MDKNFIIGHNNDGVIICEVREAEDVSLTFKVCEVRDITNLIDEQAYMERLVKHLQSIANDGGLMFWNEMSLEEKSQFTFENWKIVATLMHENMDDEDILRYLGSEYRKDLGIIEHDDSLYCFKNIRCKNYDTRHSKGLVKVDEIYDTVHKIWDEIHLGEIPEEDYLKLKDELKNVNDAYLEINKYIYKILN